MKTIVFILFIVLLIVSPVFGVENGYQWEEFPYLAKVAYLSGFLEGYGSGKFSEQYDVAMRLTETQLEGGDTECAEKFRQIKPQKCIKEISGLYKNSIELSLIIEELLKLTMNRSQLFSKKNKYYVNELDSFLKTYPLCKGINFNNLLSDLVKVWGNKEVIGKERTYKEIGEECLETSRTKE